MFDTGKIGHSFPPYHITVERVKIHEFALAIGDYTPYYHDRQKALEAGYRDVPLPPTTGTIFMFWGNEHLQEQLTELGLDVQHILHLEEAYEYRGAIYAGEALTAITTVADGATRRGPKNTTIDFATLRVSYSNNDGEEVLRAESRFVVRR